jgi:hypothetical protein
LIKVYNSYFEYNDLRPPKGDISKLLYDSHIPKNQINAIKDSCPFIAAFFAHQMYLTINWQQSENHCNIKCIEQSAIIESFKQELPNIKIDSKSVDFSGALSLCS